MSVSEPQPVEALVSALIARAAQRKFAVTRDPKELSQTQTKSASVQLAFGENSTPKAQLRPEMEQVKPPVGMFIRSHSHYAIQIGQLGRGLVTGEWEDAYYSELIEQWHGYQQYAAIARTWLLSDYSDDLNLFLVGPAGSKDESDWQSFSQVIERNDLVCRKLLWLPGKNDHEWASELAAFLDRTFLSEPWKGTATTMGVGLDPLAESMGSFDAWRVVLERPEFRTEPIDHDLLVKALLEATG
jgi:hypothetical protein